MDADPDPGWAWASFAVKGVGVTPDELAGGCPNRFGAMCFKAARQAQWIQRSGVCSDGSPIDAQRVPLPAYIEAFMGEQARISAALMRPADG